MGSSQRTRPEPQAQSGLWTTTQAYTLGVVCLVAGLAIGYLLHGSDVFTSSNTSSQVAAPASSSPASFPMPGTGMNLGTQTAEAVDKSAAPMIAQLQANPNDASIATRIGNLYDDAKIYPKAIEYYEKSVKLSPANPDVLTDLGTAYFYNGNPDQALKDFDRASEGASELCADVVQHGHREVARQERHQRRGGHVEPVAADESGLSR